MHLCCVFIFSAEVLQQPPSDSKKAVVTLSQPIVSEESRIPCLLHIKLLTALQGFSVVALEFQSGSRNVEVYEGDQEYVATCKGSLVQQSSQ